MNGSKGYVWGITCAAATVAVLGLIVFGLTRIFHEPWPILSNWLTEDGQPLSALEGSKYPPAEPGAYMRLPESRRFSAPFSYPNWSGVSNTRHVSAFMA